MLNNFIQSSYLWFTRASLIGILLTPSSSVAQIVPDRTLGNENSVVVPDQNIRGIASDRIDGGAVRGSNLFHSFEEFNVHEGRGAYFSNPDNIINILTRVTGGNISQILGTLGVLGNANLFLINPNGIFFGLNARLDVGGSFFATTADGILFENGFEFAASNPEAPPLLTINIPIGLNFRGNPGEFRVESSGESPHIPSIGEVGLKVSPGQRLALIGGNISLRGGNLIAPGGQIELGSVAGSAFVQLPTSSNPTFNYQGVSSFGNIELSQAASIDTSTDNLSNNQNSRINIQGQNVTLKTGATLWSIAPQAGSISIDAANTILINDALIFSLSSGEEGVGGDINLSAQSVFLKDFAVVVNFTQGSANSGGIFVNASDTVQLFNQGSPSLILETLETNPFTRLVIEVLSNAFDDFPRTGFGTATLNSGNAGDIVLTTSKLTIRNNINSELVGVSTATLKESTGNGGNLTVNASESIEIIGSQAEAFIPEVNLVTVDFFRDVVETGITTATNGQGNSGDLVINTGQLIIRNRAAISSGTGEPITGNAGNLIVNARESIELENIAGITTLAVGSGDAGNLTINIPNGRVIFRNGAGLGSDTVGSGDSGDITLVANELIIRNGSRIGAATGNRGNSGNITIQATSVDISGISADGTVPSGIFTSTEPQTTGTAGNLTLETQNLTLNGGAEITASTQGTGNAGNLIINATDIEVTDSNVLSRTTNEGVGGELNVNTERLNIREGGRISVETEGSGNAGSLTVQATEVELSGTDAQATASGLFASALSNTSGLGGRLTVNTNQLVVRDGATIDVRSEGLEAAGDLEINAQSVLLDNQASLNAETAGGEGDIILNTENLRLRRNSNITTNATGEAVGGNITINSNQLVAIENSDISANAQAGLGGQVVINADAVFGTQFRTQQTSASDITATSELGAEFSGTVELNNEIDPAQGLVDLPQTVVDPAALIAQDPCRQGEESEFVNTGRGGLPRSPQETVRSEETFVSLMELPPEVESRRNHSPAQRNRISRNSSTNSGQVSSLDIVPARGWIRNEKGEVILVSYDPTKTGVQRQRQRSTQCQS